MIIKVSFNGELRRVTVADEKISLKKLQKTFRKLFGSALPANYVLKYQDDENDIITVTKDKELNEAVRLFADSGKILRVAILEVASTSAAPELPKKPAQEQNSGSLDGAIRDLMGSLNLGVDPSKFLTEILPSLLNGLEVEISVNEPKNQQSTPTPVPAPATPAEKPQSEVQHAAFCDACNNNQNIRGIRYKCLQCPDYDLCGSCFEKKAHGVEHEFRSIYSPAPAFPTRGRCGRFRHGVPPQFGGPQHGGPQHGGLLHPHGHGPHHGGPHHGHGPHGHGPHHAHGPKHGGRYGRRNWREEQREEQQQQQALHAAFCDGCKNGKYITGARFKCLDAACPDFDLCSSCESAGFQNDTHKNTHQMRCILQPGDASFENVIFDFMRHCPAARTPQEPAVASDVKPSVPAAPEPSTASSVEEDKETVVADDEQSTAAVDSDDSDDESVASDDFKFEYQRDVDEPKTTVLSLESFEPLEPLQKEEQQPLLPKVEEVVAPAPTPAPAPAAPAAPAAAPSLFESMLNQLAEMGFDNRDDNIKLLVKHNGDLLEAVKELLD